MGVSENNGTPQIIHFNRVFHYKPSILGYPYFWKHPDILSTVNVGHSDLDFLPISAPNLRHLWPSKLPWQPWRLYHHPSHAWYEAGPRWINGGRHRRSKLGSFFLGGSKTMISWIKLLLFSFSAFRACQTSIWCSLSLADLAVKKRWFKKNIHTTYLGTLRNDGFQDVALVFSFK